MLACFEDTATVHDEGHAHSGHYAIGSWWENAKAKYRHVAEPIEAHTDSNGTRVLAKVTGAFPGGPATLAYGFRLAGRKITDLEIGA